MGVYRKFESRDILHSVVHASPVVELASGTFTFSAASTLGWRGSVGTSGSVSLYGGVRARYNVKSGDYASSGLSIYPLDPIDTHSIDKTIYVSGSYPSTGSVRRIWCRSTPASIPQGQPGSPITMDDWYQEHFGPIEGLFDYYSRYNSDCFTGSYDYHSLFLYDGTGPGSSTAPVVYFSGSRLSTATNAFTISAWIRPVDPQETNSSYFPPVVFPFPQVIMAQRNRWRLRVNGPGASAGNVALDFYSTSSAGPIVAATSSAAVTAGAWQNVALVVSSSTASFYINGQLDSSSPIVVQSGALAAYSASNSSLELNDLSVGCELTGAFSDFNQSFWGFVHETKIWDRALAAAEISSSWNRVLTPAESSSLNLRHYSRFNDGPYGSAHGYAVGSGVFDYSPTAKHGQMNNVNGSNELGQWYPNDNPFFITPKTKLFSPPISGALVFHVPSLYYGRQIATGSVQIACNVFNIAGLRRIVRDDGRGSLYLATFVTGTTADYSNVMRWNKIGSVFYTEGIIAITHPGVWDLGFIDLLNSYFAATDTKDPLSISFKGQERIPTNVFSCRLGAAEGNVSSNKTWSSFDDGGGFPGAGRYVVRSPGFPTYVTAVGIYNEDRKLVAIAKLAQPVRKREKDSINIRLRMDF